MTLQKEQDLLLNDIENARYIFTGEGFENAKQEEMRRVIKSTFTHQQKLKLKSHLRKKQFFYVGSHMLYQLSPTTPLHRYISGLLANLTDSCSLLTDDQLNSVTVYLRKLHKTLRNFSIPRENLIKK